MNSQVYYSPKEVATRLNVGYSHVLDLITAGSLKAIDVSTKQGHGKPRYRIPREALEQFETTRGIAPPPKRRRRTAKLATKDYFR